MSGDARITGRIGIIPAVTWAELSDKPWATGETGHPDVKVVVDVDDENTATGIVRHMTGVAIAPTGHETHAHNLSVEVRRIVKAFRYTPDGTMRAFPGWLHVVWGGGEDVYRVRVAGGAVREERPETVWPAGARDEDSVEEMAR